MRRQRWTLWLGVTLACAQGCAPCGGDPVDSADESPLAEGSAASTAADEAAAPAPAPPSGAPGAALGGGPEGAPAPGPGGVIGAPIGVDPRQVPNIAPEIEVVQQQQMRGSSCAFEVHRLVVASSVEDREPVVISGAVPATDEPVYVFAQLGNAEGPDTTARFAWDHLGSEHTHEQTMDVGVSPTWRTWVRHSLLPTRTGAWTVRVFDADGCEAGAVTFEAVVAP